MQSKASTVAQYLAELPADRRAAISAVREVILKNLDPIYVEGMGYGMMGYSVPHSVYPAGYHCDPKQPLPFAGLASQKNHMSIYMMGLYCGCVEGTQETELVRWFHQAWKKSGMKMDMGKCCIRFRKLEDLPLEIIGEAIRRQPAKKYIEVYESTMRDMEKGSGGAKKKAGGAGERGSRGAVGKKTTARKVAKSAKKKAATRKVARR